MKDYASVEWTYWVPGDYWRKREATVVEPWQACALSVGIEPKGMAEDRTDYTCGPFVGPMWGPEEKKSTVHEFERRLDLLNRDRLDSRIFTIREDGKLYLDEFVAWMKLAEITHFPLALAKLDAKPRELADWNDATAALEASETTAGLQSPRSDVRIEPNASVTDSTAPDCADPKEETATAVDSDNRQKQRVTTGRHILDPAIDKAIESAGNLEFGAVYNALKVLALREIPPFSGMVNPTNGALEYTASGDKGKTEFTKGALTSRLKRKRSKIEPVKTRRCPP